MSDPASTNDRADTAATPATSLLGLQRLDTEIDQLLHRRERLPESEAAGEARAAVVSWEAARDALRSRIDELGQVIAAAEERTSQLEADTARLQAQLKTVIAPREAEALMHEIETLDAERDGVETRELEALEEQADAEGRLEQHAGQEEVVRAASAEREALAASVVAEIDVEIDGLRSRRAELHAAVPEALVSRYERLRSHHLVAVAELVGRQCSGCHLDLSAAEVDDVKDEAAASDGVAGCPQCGRMLVL